MGLLDSKVGASRGPTKSDLRTAFLEDNGDIDDGIFRGLLYGPSGVGKSVLAGHIAQRICPAGKSILYFDTATGFQSLRNHDDLDLTRFNRKVYRGLSQLDTFAEYYEAGDEAFTKYGVVVMDEHSSMHKINLDLIMQNAEDKRAGMEDINSQPQYLTAQNQMWRTTNNFITKVPLHIIFLAHMREDPDEKKRVMIRPDYQPGLSKSLRELVSLVGYVNASPLEGQGARYLRTVQAWPSARIIAKTRVKGLSVETEVDEFVERVADWVTDEEARTTPTEILGTNTTAINDHSTLSGESNV